MDDWTRIPMEITNETDRRTMAAILASVGLEVRVVKVSAYRKYIEYRIPA